MNNTEIKEQIYIIKKEILDLQYGIVSRKDAILHSVPSSKLIHTGLSEGDDSYITGTKYIIRKYRQSIWRKRFEIIWLFLVMAWKNKR